MELWRRHSYRVSAVIFKPYISIVNGWNNYIQTWRRERVGTWCVMFQSADLFVLRTVLLKYYISKINPANFFRKAVCEFRLSFNAEKTTELHIQSHNRLTSFLAACIWRHWKDSNNFCTFPLHKLKLNCSMKGKTPTDIFRAPIRLLSVAVFFKQWFSFPSVYILL